MQRNVSCVVYRVPNHKISKEQYAFDTNNAISSTEYPHLMERINNNLVLLSVGHIVKMLDFGRASLIHQAHLLRSRVVHYLTFDFQREKPWKHVVTVEAEIHILYFSPSKSQLDCMSWD
jgi:hypothetical protein